MTLANHKHAPKSRYGFGPADWLSHPVVRSLAIGVAVIAFIGGLIGVVYMTGLHPTSTVDESANGANSTAKTSGQGDVSDSSLGKQEKKPVEKDKANEAKPEQNGDNQGNSTGTNQANNPLAGVKILLDPGHNGAANQYEFNSRQVPDGRGGYKNCQTTGTATANGFPEHTFNWKVANFLKQKLEANGAIVKLTRDSDDGLGPCVDERGAMSKGMDLVVSIHADGSQDTSFQGYFAITSSPPLNAAQGQPSVDLALDINKALGAAGFAPSNTDGDQLSQRPDLAGLNFSQAPMVMMELGQMKNPEEAAVMESEAGQQRYAQALFEGIKAWCESH